MNQLPQPQLPPLRWIQDMARADVPQESSADYRYQSRVRNQRVEAQVHLRKGQTDLEMVIDRVRQARR